MKNTANTQFIKETFKFHGVVGEVEVLSEDDLNNKLTLQLVPGHWSFNDHQFQMLNYLKGRQAIKYEHKKDEKKVLLEIIDNDNFEKELKYIRDLIDSELEFIKYLEEEGLSEFKNSKYYRRIVDIDLRGPIKSILVEAGVVKSFEKSLYTEPFINYDDLSKFSDDQLAILIEKRRNLKNVKNSVDDRDDDFIKFNVTPNGQVINKIMSMKFVEKQTELLEMESNSRNQNFDRKLFNILKKYEKYIIPIGFLSEELYAQLSNLIESSNSNDNLFSAKTHKLLTEIVNKVDNTKEISKEIEQVNFEEVPYQIEITPRKRIELSYKELVWNKFIDIASTIKLISPNFYNRFIPVKYEEKFIEATYKTETKRQTLKVKEKNPLHPDNMDSDLKQKIVNNFNEVVLDINIKIDSVNFKTDFARSNLARTSFMKNIAEPLKSKVAEIEQKRQNPDQSCISHIT